MATSFTWFSLAVRAASVPARAPNAKPSRSELLPSRFAPCRPEQLASPTAYSPFKLLWAHGSSPVLYKNSIVLLCDHDPAAYLLALDKFTGKTLWKTDRGKGLRSYSTPLVVTGEGRDELIVNSNPRIDAYDPATGRLYLSVASGSAGTHVDVYQIQ